ncbi:hypothetical protein IWW38_006248, partial [Coemansia aciculifera]
DSGFEGEDQLAARQINTVGVINPYSVQPASIHRVIIISLPVWIANSVMRALGLRTATVSSEEEVGDEEYVDGDKSAQDIVRQAVENAANPPEPSAKQFVADPEVAAKKAAKKAAKAEARRRRTPLV